MTPIKSKANFENCKSYIVPGLTEVKRHLGPGEEYFSNLHNQKFEI